jgi:hypothetical protein
MSIIPDTGYYITNSEGIPVDISTIFNPGTYPTYTNFKFYNTTIDQPDYVDLSTVINEIQPGDTQLDDTEYKVTISGLPTDLSKLFQPKITASTYYTITSTPALYPTKVVINENYYYIAFPYYTTGAIATITFNQNISNINVIVVGGGGCGRSWSFFDIIRSGGGGAGGGVAQATFHATTNDSYNISIGQGGQVLGGGVVTSGLQTTFTSGLTPTNNIVCTGGQAGINDGSGYAIGGVGTVSGVFLNIIAGAGGNGGESLTSSTIGLINNGGNSVILPPVNIPAGPFPYGLGGGGGAGGWKTSGGTAGNGIGGICGAASNGQGTTPNGFGCGGGGCASQSTAFNDNTIGNNGFVLIYFQYL